MVPWRGRLSFRQYIPGKRHKYGIKLYKLCLPEAKIQFQAHIPYYYKGVHIYSGKNEVRILKVHSEDVVMKLIENLLFEGQILFTDSFYTSVPLAEELLRKNTYICGTIKMNKKFLPPQAKQKQKRGDIMSFENRSGVKFVKWTDKRPMCMLATSPNHECTIIRGKNDKLKPDTIFSYNDAKKGVDLSVLRQQGDDFMTSLQPTCGTLLRQGTIRSRPKESSKTDHTEATRYPSRRARRRLRVDLAGFSPLLPNFITQGPASSPPLQGHFTLWVQWKGVIRG
ncbi:PiggyBac transposable element-derived protein 4, partial [Anthophora retusa]